MKVIWTVIVERDKKIIEQTYYSTDKKADKYKKEAIARYSDCKVRSDTVIVY